ncbi:MAG: hypothetical protein P8I61_01100 [Opitutae bacterium]|jgi:hypothetical protein|nr:hypothetical protein [Opitutae bacterium]
MSNKQINCWVSSETLEEIERRAKQHNMKTSAYGSLILNNWFKKSGSQTPIETELEELRNLIKQAKLDNRSKE